MKPWARFYGVGVGPGDPRLLTLRAIEVLRDVDIIAIPKSRLERESVAWEIARKHCRLTIELLELELPMTSDRETLQAAWQKGAEAVLEKLATGRSVAFVTLGDPSLYSTYSYLLESLRGKLPENLIETVPGITAMSAAAARVNLPLAEGDEPLLILPSAEGIENYLDFPNLVLMKVSRRLSELLSTLEVAKRPSVLLTRVGQSREEIRWFPQVTEFEEGKVDYLSLLITKERMREEV
ncbi:MAG: precorrin-2 C(20)-methyltransferase [Desulfitobacteriaceae bacterium]